MDNSRDSKQMLEESLMQRYGLRQQEEEGQNQLWKKNDQLAQKNGPHSAIYWVKKQKKNEDGSSKIEKWKANTKYIGDWKNNQKNGFGIQFYGNSDKYEGGWEQGKRNGQGTYWVYEGKNKLRREYTGDWKDDKKTGRGTMFYKNGDRYDGLWLDDKQHGEGRMIFANGNVYEGMWFLAKRSGYGVLTKRSGDHFEGHWINDKREGQGSYFFASKNQVFVGEWVNDMPKTGIYSEVEDPYANKQEREKHFTDQYVLPPMPQIKLKNPTDVLQEAIETVRKERTMYRASYIPLDELYSKEELSELVKEFSAAASTDKNTITEINLQAILVNMNFDLQEEQIEEYVQKIKKEDYKKDEIEFDQFARIVAIILEDSSNDNDQDQYTLQQQMQGMQLQEQAEQEYYEQQYYDQQQEDQYE